MSLKIQSEILLASPISTFKTLLELVRKLDFWQTILFSFGRIVSGFLLAVAAGTVLAAISYKSILIRELILPLMKVIKSVPVASFIILALIWIKAVNLSVLISFLMLLPMIYTNVGQGLAAADEKLLQMAAVFHIGKVKVLRAIFLPAVFPHFISAVSVGLGFCWKAGIAAEVIGIPSGSIGAHLYEAKLFLMTKELFAWTVIIIIISMIFEKLVLWLIKLLQHNT
jgi:NitT/TauT family transport system permease protein